MACSKVFGQPNNVLTLPPSRQQLSVSKPFLRQFADLNHPYTLATIRQLPADQWNEVNAVNFGSKGSPGWVTFQVRSPVRQTIWLEINSHFIDSLQIWLIQESGLYSDSIRTYRPVGFRSLARDGESPAQHRYFIKPLPLQPNVRYAVYIRGWVTPADVLKFQVTLWRPAAFWQYLQGDLASWCVFLGLILMAVFITLISFVFHPRPIYLFFCGYLLSMTCYALVNDGWCMFLPTSFGWLDTPGMVAHCLNLGLFFFLQFSRSFLSINGRTGRWWQRVNPIWLTLLLEAVIFFVAYSLRQNQFIWARIGYQVGFIILGIYALFWFCYVIDAVLRRFQPVWLHTASVVVWLFFYSKSVFIVNSGLMTEHFPEMLVFRLALLTEVGLMLIGWMYRQHIIRKSRQRLQELQQTRQRELMETERLRQAEELKALQLQNELQKQRERLARDLHDGIGSQLTHIAGRLDILSLRNSKEQDQLQRLSQFTRETNQGLRDTVWILNRSEIQLSTFAQRLNIYLLRLWEDLDTPALAWHTDLLATDPIISPLAVQCLFRITQEAVNNALKYARATIIQVNLTLQNTAITLTIADNGAGFDTAAVTSGYGLTNMQKRAEEIGALCTLNSSSSGTIIYVNMSINN